MRKFLYLAKNKRQHTVTEGIARTGEISPKGVVSHTEDWDGRIRADVGPTPIRYVVEPDGRIRPMTFKEMVDKGYFIIGKGPVGVRRKR